MKKFLTLVTLLGFVALASAEEITLKIEGMTCPAGCVQAVKDAVTSVKGATPKKVELGSALVSYDAKLASQKDIIAAITKAGYTVKQ